MKKMLVWETLGIVSGGQKMTLQVIDLLKDTYDFHCLIPTKGALSEELEKRNITYTLLGDQSMPIGVKGKSAIFRYAWLSLKAVVKGFFVVIKEKPEIIYAPGPAALPWSAAVGFLTGKKVIWHLHHIFLDGATKKLLNVCAKWKSVKKIIAISNVVGGQIVNEEAHKKVEVIYNPVDIVKYSSGNAENVREEFGDCLKKRIVVGHIALIQRPKKQDIVIQTVKALKQRGQDVIALFMGECRDEVFLNELKETVEKENLSEHVLFLGRRNDIPDLLKVMDVLIIPSTEGLSLAGLESFAAGVPVAACDIGGAKELVEASNAGKLFEIDNPEDAATQIEYCVKEKEKLSENAVLFADACKVSNFKKSISEVFLNIG